MELVRFKKNINLIRKSFKEMETKWEPYAVTGSILVEFIIPQIYVMQE